MVNILNTSINDAIPNIPKQHLNALKELDISTLKDLLYYFPVKYLDKTKLYNISELYDPNLTNKYVQVKGNIQSKSIISKSNKQRLVAKLQDETGFLDLIWFNYVKDRNKSLQIGKSYKIFGQVNMFNHNPSIIHPEVESTGDTNSLAYCLQSLYKIPDSLKKYKINNNHISGLQRQALMAVNGKLTEYIPQYIIEENQLIGIQNALYNIHFPKDNFLLNESIKRLKFEELFLLQTKLSQSKRIIKTTNIKNFIFKTLGDNFYSLYNNLPFSLTTGQQKVIREIRNDLRQPTQMNRLLQGDVGSGKTIVSLFAAMFALDNNYQVCIMAPTLIRAQQHYASIATLLKNATLTVDLLTGSNNKKRREEILTKLKNNDTQILVGTHAIIQPNVEFYNLGLAIIDEQHKFGVKQRASLWAKNKFPPHLLIMTATPIPRTLAMTAYGNLDMSVIDTMPTGRKPIITMHKYDTYRNDVYNFIRSEINSGRQAYIVYPIIEESASLDYQNLIEGHKHILEVFNKDGYAIGLVHGKMSIETKQEEMQKFKDGKTDILVATPVIEVGIDVPNSTIMLIESCQRFGLSQLHQIRGRIGRSDKQSYCILMTPYNISKEVKYKLDTMVKTNDGFQIADADLKLRGPGDIEGVKQSGIMELKIANLITDNTLINQIKIYVENIFKQDPNLSDIKHTNIAKYLSDIKYNTMVSIS
ncbi:MAG: ATP-dependent DNA helicase RecG [Solitalea-like symbiont of Acarus siro]